MISSYSFLYDRKETSVHPSIYKSFNSYEIIEVVRLTDVLEDHLYSEK